MSALPAFDALTLDVGGVLANHPHITSLADLLG